MAFVSLHRLDLAYQPELKAAKEDPTSLLLLLLLVLTGYCLLVAREDRVKGRISEEEAQPRSETELGNRDHDRQ